MPIVGGLDIHRKQLTFDYLDTVTGEVKRGQIAPADRAHLRAWLARFAGHDDVAFAVEGCGGWRYVTEELAAAGIGAHLGEPAGTAALRGRKRHKRLGWRRAGRSFSGPPLIGVSADYRARPAARIGGVRAGAGGGKPPGPRSDPGP
jgi:hypothetical protein